MKVIKLKSNVIQIYCASFIILIIETLIGLFQLLYIINREENLFDSGIGQFRIINLIIDLIVLIGIGYFLLWLWRKFFKELEREKIMSYNKNFIILAIFGVINLSLVIFLFFNPFSIDFNLRESPIGHIYDVMAKVGIIFFLVGILGIVLNKIERRKKTQSVYK